MQRHTRLVAAVAAGAAMGALALGGSVTYVAYFRFADRIAGLVREIPEHERHTPLAFKQALARVHPDGVVPFAVMYLVAEVAKPGGELANGLLEELWQRLVPWQLSPDDLLAVYVHSMPFEHGRGLTYGADYYFSKNPEALTYRESIALLVVAQAPRSLSPQNHPERFAEAVRRYGG